jgi:hypothetical protein
MENCKVMPQSDLSMLNRFVRVRDAGHGRARSPTARLYRLLAPRQDTGAVASERGALDAKLDIRSWSLRRRKKNSAVRSFIICGLALASDFAVEWVKLRIRKVRRSNLASKIGSSLYSCHSIETPGSDTLGCRRLLSYPFEFIVVNNFTIGHDMAPTYLQRR